jgi:hypothetical protein
MLPLLKSGPARVGLITSLMFFGLICPTLASAGQQTLQETPNELVRRVVAREMTVDQNVRYMYRHYQETSAGSQTRHMIETRDGIIARMLAINGRLLNAEERRKDDERLEWLMATPSEMRKRQKQQQENEQRVRRVVRALPDAFLYEFNGTDTGSQGQLLRLTFKPNPTFNADSREAQVLKGMGGTLWIDPAAQRIARLEATLFKDVSFGWGFLGHLNKGGRLVIEQIPVGEGRWQRSRLEMDLTGRVLLLKSVRIKQTQVVSDFRAVPLNLSFAEGVELLRRADSLPATAQVISGN